MCKIDFKASSNCLKVLLAYALTEIEETVDHNPTP